MSKILQVIEPFFTTSVGDTFVLSKDGSSYVTEHNEEIRAHGDNDDLNATYNSSFEISPKWAKQLIKEGFLVEAEPEEKKNDSKSSFVNVFDEIDNLLAKYNTDLSNIGESMKAAPECLRVEKTTVLSNIIGVLEHLKALRK